MNQYSCKSCQYSTCFKQNYDKHLSTIKHKNSILTSDTKIETTNPVSIKKVKIYICGCNKEYKSYSGWWRHKKTCEGKPTTTEKSMEETDLKEELETMKKLILQIMKNQMTEKDSSTIYNNNNYNNSSHNFNINFFLNEQCKNAIDIMDFVENVVKEITNVIDIQKIPEIGYVETLTLAVTKSIKNYDVYKRPIHNIENNEDIQYYIRHNELWNTEYNDNQTSILDKALRTLDMSMYHKITKMPECSDRIKENLFMGNFKKRLEVKENILNDIYVESHNVTGYLGL